MIDLKREQVKILNFKKPLSREKLFHPGILFQFGSTERATSRIDIDLALAERAGLDSDFLRGLFHEAFLGLIHCLDNQEKHKRREDELDQHCQEADNAAGKPGSAGFKFGQRLKNRIQENIDYSRDNFTERCADDNTDGHVHDVAAHCKRLELLEELFHQISFPS